MMTLTLNLAPRTLLAAALLLPIACDKSNSLGEVEDTGADDGSEATGTDTGEPATDAGDDGATSADTGGVPLVCQPGQLYAEPPACEVGVAPPILEAGCFDECSEGQDCGAGTTCQVVQYNPCPCPPDAEVCCGACGAETSLCMPDTFDAVCGSIIGQNFESVDELECGLEPMGPVLCHWTISFADDGSYLWMHSDVGQGGSYTCEAGVIAVDLGTAASFDPVTQILEWDGVLYQAVSPT
jgi:hypothetical protein